MSIVAIITARGGSKRLPGKNILPFAGKPLLEWTCDAALGAKNLDRIILSTDCEKIANVGRECGVEVPFLRPKHLATDEANTLSVLQHLLDWLEKSVSVDALVLLQPTSPLRQSQDIDNAIELLRKENVDSVVSVTKIPPHYRTNKLMIKNSIGLVEPLDPITFPDSENLVVRNGPAVLVTRPHVLHAGGLYGKKTLAYEMPYERSIDIDTVYDFSLAEMMLQLNT